MSTTTRRMANNSVFRCTLNNVSPALNHVSNSIGDVTNALNCRRLRLSSVRLGLRSVRFQLSNVRFGLINVRFPLNNVRCVLSSVRFLLSFVRLCLGNVRNAPSNVSGGLETVRTWSADRFLLVLVVVVVLGFFKPLRGRVCSVCIVSSRAIKLPLTRHGRARAPQPVSPRDKVDINCH